MQPIAITEVGHGVVAKSHRLAGGITGEYIKAELVETGTASQHIVAVFSVQNVRAVTALKTVSAGSAIEPVVHVFAKQGVVATFAVQPGTETGTIHNQIVAHLCKPVAPKRPVPCQDDPVAR